MQARYESEVPEMRLLRKITGKVRKLREKNENTRRKYKRLGSKKKDGMTPMYGQNE